MVPNIKVNEHFLIVTEMSGMTTTATFKMRMFATDPVPSSFLKWRLRRHGHIIRVDDIQVDAKRTKEGPKLRLFGQLDDVLKAFGCSWSKFTIRGSGETNPDNPSLY